MYIVEINISGSTGASSFDDSRAGAKTLESLNLSTNEKVGVGVAVGVGIGVLTGAKLLSDIFSKDEKK